MIHPFWQLTFIFIGVAYLPRAYLIIKTFELKSTDIFTVIIMRNIVMGTFANKYLAFTRDCLKPWRKVGLFTNQRIAQTVVTAKIADVTVAGGNADTDLQTLETE